MKSRRRQLFLLCVLTCLLVPSAGAQTATVGPAETPAPPRNEELPPGIWRQSHIITRAADEFERRMGGLGGPDDGFFIEMGNSITGAGFPTAGPGYRHHVFGDSALFTTSATLSSRLYNTLQARIEWPNLASERVNVGAQTLYMDSVRVDYFGLGSDTLVAQRSGYRLQDIDTSGFVSVKVDPFIFTVRGGLLAGLRVGNMAGFDAPYPNTRLVYDEVTAPGITRQPAFAYTELSVAVDRRDNPGHPTRGGLYQGTWAHYDDRDATRETFDRYELSGTHYIATGSDNWILSVRGFSALSRTVDGNRVPFYLTPSLGGRTTLPGYRDYRFHGDQMAMVAAESRWALLRHLDAAVFTAFGKIGSTIDELARSDTKPSYGFGVRFHSDRMMIGRVDVAHSPEGWRFIFAMSEPLQRSRPAAGSTSVVPFVP
jgi:hypothetical protein